MQVVDLVGQRFGRLVVLEYLGRERGQTWWLCQCDCGKIIKTASTRLKNGQTKSCGCYNIEMSRLKNSTHNQSKTRLYRIYRSMIGRCKYKYEVFKHYSGKGIEVCPEWLESYEKFAEWSMQNGYSDKLTIDRKNNDKGYSPENCRWVDTHTQACNRTNNHRLTYNNETKTITEWGEQYGISYSIIRDRLLLGWSVEKAITTPQKIFRTRRKSK